MLIDVNICDFVWPLKWLNKVCVNVRVAVKNTKLKTRELFIRGGVSPLYGSAEFMQSQIGLLLFVSLSEQVWHWCLLEVPLQCLLMY